MTADFQILSRYFGVAVKPKANPALQRERALGASSMAKAKRLAAANGIDIEPDGRSAWWVTCDKLTGDKDPLDGANFCTDGREVLEAVEAYIEALGAGSKA